MTFTTRTPRLRPMLQFSLRAAATLLFAALLGGLVGLVLRDRLPVVALLMYVPLLPLGAAAAIWDIAARGEGLPKWRFALGAIGLIALACNILTMSGPIAVSPPPAVDAPGVAPLTVLHWNVRWGGGGGGEDGKLARWNSLCAEIAGRAPDIVILNESPRIDLIDQFTRTLGPRWTHVRSQNRYPTRYFYRLVVAAPWPVTREFESAIPSGRVMQAVVAAPGGDVRILVVDGESHVWHDRTPRLRAVAQLCRDAAASGRPIDLIAGDFNAVGRSVGFDAIADAGFVSAGAAAPGWRATWPSILPLYDIDHVWVSDRWATIACERFSNRVTDHRGQVAHVVRRGDDVR